MKTKFETALTILKTLRASGHEAVFAGGCVRDRVLGKEPKDYDIVTSAVPETVQKLFSHTVPVGVQFGVILVVEEGHCFEVATFRTEGAYEDGRRPDKVAFATMQEDAKRRDFTVNGMYWDGESKDPIDFVGGVQDLKNKIIRTIGEPSLRFQEDHLRLLRAIRFAVQLEFEIEADTLKAVTANHALIVKTSVERIRDEWIKMMTSCNPARAIRLLDDSGMLSILFPDVVTMKGVEQPIQYHPEGDVYVHTLMLLDQLKNAPMELAFGALFHDIAKPATFERAVDRIRFHGHDKIGAEMTEKILRHYAFSNDQIEIICSLVAEHLRFKDAMAMRKSTLKRFFSLKHFEWHLELHRIDCLASHKDLTAYHFCMEKYQEHLKSPPPSLKLLMGKDLIEEGYKPGPFFAEILRKVEDEILEGNIHSKEEALSWLRKNYSPGK